MISLRAVAALWTALSLLALPVAYATEHSHANEHAHTLGHVHDQKDKAASIDKHLQADIERHKAMATAHQDAAQCLASGKDHDVCQKELVQACKGLALGKHCGMRHAH